MKKLLFFALAAMLTLFTACDGKLSDPSDPETPNTPDEENPKDDPEDDLQDDSKDDPEDKPDVHFDLQFEVEGVHATAVDVLRAIPSETETTYYYCIIEASRFEEEGGKEGIFDFDLSWWQYLADYNQVTWQKVLELYLYKGISEVRSDKYIDPLTPETDYVMYGYAITPEGEKTTDVFTMDFRTGKPEMSDNVIEITIKDIHSDSVILDVATSNQDRYFLITQPKEFWDKYESDKASMANQLAETYIGLGIYDFFFNGPQKDLSIPCSADTDYYVIAFGYEDGLTTDVIGIPFRTDPL